MKEQIITFKVDSTLYALLEKIPNKSEFIRNSISKALDSLCPLCNGTGILKPCQKNHWDEFIEHHSLVECEECKTVHLSCNNIESH